MKRLLLLLTFILNLTFGHIYKSYAQILPGNNPNPYGICEMPPPGCQEIPICTYYDDCFRFDFYQPVNRPDGTTVLKHKITNFSESTFKQAAFELPGTGSPRTPAVWPTGVFRNRYKHDVINPFNDTMIAYNAKNAGTFSYGGFEVYYYVVNTADFNAPSGRFITVNVKAGRSWQPQRTGSVVIDVDACLGIPPCPLPIASLFIFPPEDLCLFNDDPYVISAVPQPNATFNWTVTNASIISGQGTNSINIVPDSAEGTLRVNLVVTNQCGFAIAGKLFNVIDCDTIVPLPVSLVSFTGKTGSEGIVLTWKTASEKDNARFEIERSPDGKSFERIGTVKGSGNSNTLLHYSYLDNLANQGLNFYRLKQVDYNGRFEYSHIVAVRNDEKAKAFAIQLLPNPCPDQQCAVKLQATDQINPVTIEIQDLAGRIIYSKQIPADQTTFELPKLNSGGGIYILSAKNGRHTAFQKIILQ